MTSDTANSAQRIPHPFPIHKSDFKGHRTTTSNRDEFGVFIGVVDSML